MRDNRYHTTGETLSMLIFSKCCTFGTAKAEAFYLYRSFRVSCGIYKTPQSIAAKSRSNPILTLIVMLNWVLLGRTTQSHPTFIDIFSKLLIPFSNRIIDNFNIFECSGLILNTTKYYNNAFNTIYVRVRIQKYQWHSLPYYSKISR